MSEVLIQIYEDGEWLNGVIQTFTYNEQNQCTSFIVQLWEWDLGQWKNVDKLSFTYDTQNNITSELWQNWVFGQWINDDKSTWSYDENHNATSGNYQYWNINSWVDGDYRLEIPYNNKQSTTFAEGYRFSATYIDPKNVCVKENSFTNSVHLYPNPVSNVLHVETGNFNVVPEVKIYSTQGALLMQAMGTQIDVSSLPKGVYVAEINGISRKIVKQ